MLAIVFMAIVQDQDAFPPIEDLERFPARQVVREQLRLYNCHLEALQIRRQVWCEFRSEIDQWIEQTRDAVAIWDVLDSAQLSTPLDVRRGWLEVLRHRMRPWNYDAGRLPPLICSKTYPKPIPDPVSNNQ